MATGVIPNEGKEVLLDIIFNGTVANPILRLFKSNTTPGVASVYADFTWADFTGYSAATLTVGSWTTTAADPGTSTFAQQTFTSTATAQTIYGWAITQGTSKLLFVKRFDSALSISSSTPPIKITPLISLDEAA